MSSYIAPFSDPAMTDVTALRELGRRNNDLAISAAVNPNLPEADVVELLAARKQSVDFADSVAIYVLARLSGQAQADLIYHAQAKNPRAAARLMRAASADGWAELASRWATNPPKRAVSFESNVRETLDQAITDATRGTCAPELPAGFADTVRTFPLSPTRVVAGWQLRDVTVLEELLDGFTKLPAGTTVGVDGLADRWFDKGGKWQVAACHDPELNIDKVLVWLADQPWLEPDAFKALIWNVRVPFEALRDAVLRGMQFRWTVHPDGEDAPDGEVLGSLPGYLDDRFQKFPRHVSGRLVDVADTDVLEQLVGLETMSSANERVVKASLLANPHLPVVLRDQALEVFSYQWGSEPPMIQRWIAQAAAGAQVEVGHFKFPSLSGCGHCKFYDGSFPPPAETETAREQLEQRLDRARRYGTSYSEIVWNPRSVRGVWVTLLGPALAAILPDGDAWYEFIEHASHHRWEPTTQENVLALAQRIADRRPQKPAPVPLNDLLGNPLDD